VASSPPVVIGPCPVCLSAISFVHSSNGRLSAITASPRRSSGASSGPDTPLSGGGAPCFIDREVLNEQSGRAGLFLWRLVLLAPTAAATTRNLRPSRSVAPRMVGQIGLIAAMVAARVAEAAAAAANFAIAVLWGAPAVPDTEYES